MKWGLEMEISEMDFFFPLRGGQELGGETHTSRWAARLARKALWTSRARLGGRLSFLLRPRFDDM